MADFLEILQPDLVSFYAVGKPGHRVFYFYVEKENARVVLKMEKQQVSALSDSLRKILPESSPLITDKDYEPPMILEPTWVVGTIGVKYDTAADNVIIIMQELTDEQSEQASVLEVIMTTEQASKLAKIGMELIEKGRPICMFCGGPIDEEGHVCPRANGHSPKTEN